MNALTCGLFPPGSFCFRIGRDDSVVLSIVAHEKGVIHFRLVDVGNGQLKVEKAARAELSFGSVYELVTFYTDTPISANTPCLLGCIPLSAIYDTAEC
jgi:hypothetical protein